MGSQQSNFMHSPNVTATCHVFMLICIWAKSEMCSLRERERERGEKVSMFNMALIVIPLTTTSNREHISHTVECVCTINNNSNNNDVEHSLCVLVLLKCTLFSSCVPNSFSLFFLFAHFPSLYLVHKACESHASG